MNPIKLLKLFGIALVTLFAGKSQSQPTIKQEECFSTNLGKSEIDGAILIDKYGIKKDGWLMYDGRNWTVSSGDDIERNPYNFKMAHLFADDYQSTEQDVEVGCSYKSIIAKSNVNNTSKKQSTISLCTYIPKRTKESPLLRAGFWQQSQSINEYTCARPYTEQLTTKDCGFAFAKPTA